MESQRRGTGRLSVGRPRRRVGRHSERSEYIVMVALLAGLVMMALGIVALWAAGIIDQPIAGFR